MQSGEGTPQIARLARILEARNSAHKPYNNRDQRTALTNPTGEREDEMNWSTTTEILGFNNNKKNNNSNNNNKRFLYSI